MTEMSRLLAAFGAVVVKTQRRLDQHARVSLDAFGETGTVPSGYSLTRSALNLHIAANPGRKAAVNLVPGSREQGRLSVAVTFRPTTLTDFAGALDDDGHPLGENTE